MYDEDNALNQLLSRIAILKEQRSQAINELIPERREVELMEREMSKMKKEKSYLEGLYREKARAVGQYDRIIAEAERIQMTLSDNVKKLLLSVDHNFNKLMQR